MAKILLLTEAAAAVGLSRQQVDRMVATGVVRPIRRSTGRGSASCFDRRDLVVMGGIARPLLGQRWPLESIVPVTDWVYSMPFEVIEECLADGRTHLMATSGNGPAPRLIEASDLGLFAPMLAAACASGHGTFVADLKLCLERVDAYLSAEIPAAIASGGSTTRSRA